MHTFFNLPAPNCELCLAFLLGRDSTQQAVLLGRTRQAVYYRRKNLCKIILGDSFAPEYLDPIINAL